MTIDILKGLTLTKVEKIEDDEIHFACGGREFVMYHEQDCCESVYIDDINGDLNDLVGSPILVAEERCEDYPEAYESGTWTFYTLRTNKGSVDIRWVGESNGYYSESVSVLEVKHYHK